MEGVKYFNCPLHQTDEIRQKTSISEQIAFYDDGKHLQERTYESVFLDPIGLKSMRKIFSILNDDDGAVLIHCSQGKDRTGVILFLIETALGVSYDDCLDDYLLSNLYTYTKEMAFIEKNIVDFSGSYRDAKKFIQIQEVNPRYLRASFDTIVANYGSIENFLINVLSVDIQSLRRSLLE